MRRRMKKPTAPHGIFLIRRAQLFSQVLKSSRAVTIEKLKKGRRPGYNAGYDIG
jgi:hypothetical protein